MVFVKSRVAWGSLRFAVSVVAVVLLALVSEAEAQPAFPSARGFGASVYGGRGGRVLKVTTLDPTGPGSLQSALDERGPRIIVFDVSGVIEADIIKISNGDVTIAGQSAPGAGITIHGHLYADYDDSVSNIVMRHLRVRPQPLTDSWDEEGEQHDAIQLSLVSHFMLDHVSVSWASDENIDLYGARHGTVQWSTVEASGTEGHPEGMHNYGLINGPDGGFVSVVDNLFAHHRNRCPALASGPADVRNNVIYDVENAFVHHNPAQGDFNIIGNYFRRGPSAELTPFWFDDEAPDEAVPTYFLSGNYVDDPGQYVGYVENPWNESDKHPSFDRLGEHGHISDNELDFSAESEGYVSPNTVEATKAYELVLAQAGAFPRDVVTRETIRDVRDRGGAWGADVPADLLEGLFPAEALADQDGDGMPDSWEKQHGLDPRDPEDSNAKMTSGYSAIETYLNERADRLLGKTPDGHAQPEGGTVTAPHEEGSEDSGGSAAGGDNGAGIESPAQQERGVAFDDEEPSGCACATAGHERRGWSWLWLGGALVLFGSRRRR